MRTAWLCLVACAVLGLVPGWAGADATPRSLRVRALAAIPPTNLRMRPGPVAGTGAANTAIAQTADGAADGAGPASAAPGAPAGPDPAGAGADMAGRRRSRGGEQLPGGPSLAERVLFRFNIGFGLDGGQPTDEPRLNGTPCGIEPMCLQQYTRNRIYGFGDAVLGSRGVLMSTLNGYFAAQFRLDQNLRDGFSAVPSVYDGEDVTEMQMRSAYGELQGISKWRWLRRLYVRAGRQYRYGAAVAHFDGLTASYDTRVGSVGLFGGAPVYLYSSKTFREESPGGGISGVNARLNLAALGLGPVVLTANNLAYGGNIHSDLAAAVRWRRHLDTQVRLRRLNGKLAQADVQVRTRLSAVTVAMLDLEHSTRRDWRYDVFSTQQRDGTDVRRYLGLELPGPRTYVSLRAGTVLVDNVDLLVRGSAVVEHDDPEDDASDEEDTSFASSYLEGGAALELRLQRTLSLGLSTVLRGYRTQDPPAFPENPLETVGPQALPEHPGYAHARSFVEAGAVVRYTQGARLFSADAEFYGRVYERELLYETTKVPADDERVGGRLSVESWAGERLRLRLEYDVTAELPVLPELRGLKSLRVLMEGRF